MTARREQLAMSQNKAAKTFGGSRTTWINWEKDQAAPERFNYVRIELTLKWAPGSVKAILDGRQPTAIEDVAPAVPPIPEDVRIDPADWAAMTDEHREQVVRILRAARRRQQRGSA